MTSLTHHRHHYPQLAPYFTSHCTHCHLPNVMAECWITAGPFSSHLTTSRKLVGGNIPSARLARKLTLVMDLGVARDSEYGVEGPKSWVSSSHGDNSTGSSRPPGLEMEISPTSQVRGNWRSRTSVCNHPARHESGYSCLGSTT